MNFKQFSFRKFPCSQTINPLNSDNRVNITQRKQPNAFLMGVPDNVVNLVQILTYLDMSNHNVSAA